MLVRPLPWYQVNLPRVKTVVYWGEPSGLALQALQVGQRACLRVTRLHELAGCGGRAANQG